MCSITVSTSSTAKITPAVAKAANPSTTAIGTSTITATVAGSTVGAEKLNPFGSESIKRMMTKNEST